MGDSKREEQLLQDVGRLARHKRVDTETDDSGYQPLSEARRAAIIDHVLDSANDNRRGWLKHLVGYLSTAAAAALVAVFITNQSRDKSDTSDEAVAVKPPFNSWKIDGGGPPAPHQGTSAPSPKRLICQGQLFTLTLAVTRGRTIDPDAPLELVLRVTPNEGQAHRFAYDIRHDERFEWSKGEPALVFDGTIETLAPIPVGSWTLEPSLGAPGVCSPEGDLSACTSLRSIAVEIVDGEHCDAAE